MEIKLIANKKKRFLELLLLADEQESMIDRYLENGDMYGLWDGGLKTVCVVTCEGEGIYEIKNIATLPDFQGMGYGKCMINWIIKHYGASCKSLIVGTGDSPLTIPFYESCGFKRYCCVKNFFTDNYDHPIFECGKQLVDMIYLKKDL